MIKLKRLKRSTCFAFGAAGALVSLLGGVLMALGFGAAQYANTGAFILTSAMILLSATLEKGRENLRKRLWLLVLFFMLLIANIRLPLLDLFEVPVVPMFCMWYGEEGDKRRLMSFALMELALAILRTMAYTQSLGGNPQQTVGFALMAVSLIRFVMLLQLNRRAVRTPETHDDELHGLR